MPTKGRPGIGASILIGWEAKAKDKSLLKVVILDNLTPSAGFKVYWVTVGPVFTPDISTSISKFCKVLLIMVELILISPAEGMPLSDSSKSRGGKR